MSTINSWRMGRGMHHAVLPEQFRYAVAAMPPSHRPNLIARTPPIAKQPDEPPIGYVGTLRRATAWTRKICTMPIAAGFVLRDGWFWSVRSRRRRSRWGSQLPVTR